MFKRGNGKVKLSATHALQLQKVIILHEEFQDHRYKLVWLVAPNPDDPTELARLANKATMLDRRLPPREVKSMCGAMNNNHLICGLLM